MGFKRFSIWVIGRCVLLMINLMALAYTLALPGYHTTTAVLCVILLVQGWALIQFISKTNQELNRFLEALEFADYTQKFELKKMGSGFEELAQSFSQILAKFQQSANQKEADLRHTKAMVEHVPVPLLSINTTGAVFLWNHAARRLFGTYQPTQLTDLAWFGADFADHITQIKPSERRLVELNIDGMSHKLSIAASEITLSETQEKLISLHDIQNELDFAQLQAWQDLVKVLTHEIMNSITPIASLANTASGLAEQTSQQAYLTPELKEELSDIHQAVETVARRSDGLIQFVASYRQLTELPTPHIQTQPVKHLFEQVQHLTAQNSQPLIQTSILPESLCIDADPDLLVQVLLNLIKNAQHAVQNLASPEIKISAYLNPRGHSVIEVSDKGDGVPKEALPHIFVPFYTTKKQGSGVGLALTRQVMLAHGGNVSYHKIKSGGACFRLTF